MIPLLPQRAREAVGARFAQFCGTALTRSLPWPQSSRQHASSSKPLHGMGERRVQDWARTEPILRLIELFKRHLPRTALSRPS